MTRAPHLCEEIPEVHNQQSLESGNAIQWSKRGGKIRLTIAGVAGSDEVSKQTNLLRNNCVCHCLDQAIWCLCNSAAIVNFLR